MSLRRLVPALCLSVLASAGVVGAAPTKKGPVAPAKDPSDGSGSGSGSAAAPAPAAPATPVNPNAPVAPEGAAGSAAAGGTEVQMSEDDAPKDINGTDENPDAPRGVGVPDDTGAAPIPVKKLAPSGYPTEEVLRPITLPENMSEVGIAPHFEVSRPLGPAFNSKSEFVETDALRARYGVTRQVQIGLTYEYGGIYEGIGASGTSFNAGRAVGLDVTVLLQNWIAVQLGVPVYLDPVAVALTLAAPIKFQFLDGKLALGGLDDLLSIKLDSFVPSFAFQSDNEEAAHDVAVNTITSRGDLRFSIYGIYQYLPNVAIIGRAGVDLQDLGNSSTVTYLRGLVQWSPRNYLDLGAGLGFDDLAHGGTFGLDFLLRVRI